ncbi:unnamed protein product, partial [Polarella glacialis]
MKKRKDEQSDEDPDDDEDFEDLPSTEEDSEDASAPPASKRARCVPSPALVRMLSDPSAGAMEESPQVRPTRRFTRLRAARQVLFGSESEVEEACQGVGSGDTAEAGLEADVQTLLGMGF